MKPPSLASAVRTVTALALVLGTIAFPFARPVWPQLFAALAAGAIAAAIVGTGKEERRQERGIIALLVMLFIQNFARDIWPRPPDASGGWNAFVYASQSGAALAVGFALCGIVLVLSQKKEANSEPPVPTRGNGT
jgi:hypothetical protein